MLEIMSLRGPMGRAVERDEHCCETRTLSVVAKLARREQLHWIQNYYQCFNH